MQQIIPIDSKDIDFDFLLHRNQSYELIKAPESDLELLPTVSIEWEEYLKFRDIAYNKKGDKCTIYDKNSYKSIRICLPVFEEYNGEYIYTGEHRGKKIPTKGSLEAAKVIYEEFVEYITEIQIMEIRQLIGKKIMVFVPKPTKIPLKEYNLREKYKVFVYEVGKVGYILVDCKKIATMKKNGEKITVNLYAPSSCVGPVIGPKFKNVNILTKLLGVDKINVLPID